jgi:succinate-semialdehyde dehydrogenase / glutarate-semialdehyde dehydrogenase
MNYETINPATAELIASCPAWTDERLESALEAGAVAMDGWRWLDVSERCRLLRQAAEVLRRDRERFAGYITLEMGKVIREARAEIDKCAAACDYYAEHAPAMLADEPVTTDASHSYISYLPLGMVFAIMPWNFPFWQVFRFAAPTLAAGNTALLKHAPNVPQCALAIEEVFQRAGFPDHVFTNLFIDTEQAGRVIADRRIHGVTLTGSERAGAQVAAAAGRAIKKTVLELGGSDAFLVLEDADLEQAADIAVASRFMNAGQSCIAAKRFIPVGHIAEDFISAVKARIEQLVTGDPMSESTDLGPMARADLRAHLHEQVETSIRAGAQPLLGCQPLAGSGFFYAPSILDEVALDMPAACQELFGPVAVIIRADNDKDAVRIANATDYGLGSTICSRDPEHAQTLAREIESGATFINCMVRSDPRLPFGGVKLSGYGRELSRHGLREFCNIKTVYVA